MRRWLLLSVALVLCASSARAVELVLPSGAQLTVERATSLDSFDAPTGAFSEGAVPVQKLEGSVTRRAWRIGAGGLTPLQVVAPLRDQIEALGFDVVFECTSRSCGGFDFRFAVEVLPGPNMYVNIGAYRYLTAFRGPGDNPDEALTVLASVTGASAYVQVIHTVTGTAGRPPAVVQPTVPAAVPDQVPEGQPGLLEKGFLVLRDLDFDTGTTALGPGPFGSLEQLAALLRSRPELRIALVGHTDTVGGLAPNVTLSRQRARAVRARLIEQYQIDPGRLEAEGMGYLAPIASNQTPEGRDRNRRVEAILLNTE